MGGQNHQPCNRPQTSYLRFSTKMSRDLSVARTHMETANIHLEDVLLGELEENRGGALSKILDQLTMSSNSLVEMQETILLLREDMDANAFEDLPTLHSADLDGIGVEFSSVGIVENGAWNSIVDIMREHGFYGVLDFFDQEISFLQQQTGELNSAIRNADSAARAGQLNLVLEQNQPANFKVQFAQLYSAWHRFQQIFLASSMLSTELWYRYCGVGSLLEQTSGKQVA